MAVQPPHLNVFPSHLLHSREIHNPSFENVSNLHDYPAAGMTVGAGFGVSPATESALLYNVLTNTMSNQMLNPPLKDDIGVTFNTNAPPPFPRKRPREQTNVYHDKLSANGDTLPLLGNQLSVQMMQQQHQTEANRLISLHMDKVKSELETRRRNERRRLIRAMEGAIASKVREKEEDVERMGKLNQALEEQVRCLYTDNQIWRDIAQKNEAAAAELRSNLEQVLSQMKSKEEEEEAESCCGSSGAEEVVGWKKVARRRMCRRCGSGESSVLVLPCRHLCLCRGCGPTADTCPVCNSTKNATLHLNFDI